jgi:uncharacterized protein
MRRSEGSTTDEPLLRKVLDGLPALRPGPDGGRVQDSAKILVGGGLGVGKSTLVSAISETRPLRTEDVLTGTGIDNVSSVRGKTTTTVAMDFGRITFDDDLVLYLFGAPGQERFSRWDRLASGALGAAVLADTRRLADCFASVNYFERRETPFIVAVNSFDGAKT